MAQLGAIFFCQRAIAAAPVMQAFFRMAGTVVTLDCGAQPLGMPERRRHEALAQRIADLKGSAFAGAYPAHDGSDFDRPVYFVPHDTIVGCTTAERLGIQTRDDFFGGVVPHWFVSTKAIVHELVGPDAVRPDGWSNSFSAANVNRVLPGYTAFTPGDALTAGKRLLEFGPVRVKDVFAAGGQDQAVARSEDEIDAIVSAADRGDRTRWAIVLEVNLDPMETYSVGEIYLDGTTIAYWGEQRQTKDNRGDSAYGGSDLHVIRGSFRDALRKDLPAPVRTAIEQAIGFDGAARKHYRGVVASRRNYDVGHGVDGRGVPRSGVLDQSWRIGGTSGVEIVALEIFKDRPDIDWVRGSSFNIYGAEAPAPTDAIVHFHGVDDELGPILIYTAIESYGGNGTHSNGHKRRH